MGYSESPALQYVKAQSSYLASGYVSTVASHYSKENVAHSAEFVVYARIVTMGQVTIEQNLWGKKHSGCNSVILAGVFV